MFTSTMGDIPKMRGLSRWLLIACLVILAAQSGSSGETRVVCYYTNWSVYRPGTAKFNPQNINPYLCTHLIYAFGGFTKENTLKPFDKYQDIEKGGYAKFTGLKTYNPNLKTMIAIGGWNEGSSRFSSLVSSSERRRELVKNAIKFMRQNKFDGLDLDWEYPAFRDGGKPKDKANYAKLVQELREEFEKESQATGRPRLLLTMAVPAGIEYIDKGYDIPKLNRYLDWMNILSYDYHSAFEPAVNHHSPLFPLEAASEYNYDSELNIDYSIKHYIEAGADRDKLVLGIPTYGRSYTLFNPDSNALGAPADGPGAQGEATREKGYLAYYEICESLLPKSRRKRQSDDEDDEDNEDASEEREEWTIVQPNPNAMGPYAYKGNQWVGYDDIDIVKKKAEYVAENGLGGIMFWSIDNDDFRGKCHGKPYPLIEAAKGALYKSLGISEKVTPPKKAQSGDKRTRPKPSKSDEEKDISKNTIRNRNRNRITEAEAGSESSTSSSSRRRQNLKRTSTSTVAPSSATPDWGLNTPEPPTTPDPGTDFKCEEEGFYPHPRDCKKYFWCLDSGPSNLGIVAHQFTCPSGLYFNKAADSCDFARNVLCNKKKATTTTSAPAVTKSATTSRTTTTSAPRTTTAPTRISSQLANLFTTRRPPPKITAATSKTTLLSRPTSTSPIPPEHEYDDEEIIEEDGIPEAEEDPKVIKELIDLIKKLGGIEQLEKHLEASGNTQGARITTPPTVSRLLYERVLSQARPQGERAPPQINSRGPQAAGLEKFTDPNVKTSRWEKPQYTTINRQRPSTTTEEAESYESEEIQEDVKESPSSTVRTNLPQYVNIRRGRPSSTTDVPESTARNALYERGSDETDSDIDDVKNGVQGFEYTNIRRFRPESQDATTSKYKTIQRARPTTTETIHEDVSENSRFTTTSPVEVYSQYISSTENPIQTSPKYATVARFPTTISPQTVETTTVNSRNNDITDSNDINVEIASPSFASENGIVKNKDNSVLNAQISLLSNNVKSKDDVGVTPSSIPIVSYSTEITVSEDPFFSTSRGTPIFVKRTRPTTTTTTTEKQPETTSQSSSDKKVSFNRVYSNVRRTPAQSKARLSDSNVLRLGQDSVGKTSDSVLGETNENVIEYKQIRSRVRKIRSTTPSSQENTTDSENDQLNYGNRRSSRLQTRVGLQRSNSVLRGENKQLNIENDAQIDRLATSGESIRKPTFRSRRLQTSSTSQRSDEEDGEITTQRSQPVRRFRPSLKDFGPDLSSLTALDSLKRKTSETDGTIQSRNVQVNRRFRPSYASTKPPLEDSEDSDSSISPVRTVAQRTFAPRGGRFTTVRTTEADLDEEASEASVIPRGRKLSIVRFAPRPFSKVSNEVLDDTDDTEAQEENDLAAEVSFDSAPIGKARLTAPAISVSGDSQTSSTAALPLSSINVTKVINSNILLGQSNNRSGILLVRRLSKPAININISQANSTDENSEAIHLSESNIDEQEQNEENILPVDRPRKRIIVKKTRPKTATDTDTISSAATERIEVTSAISKDPENTDESINKEKPRVRKVLVRRPASTTASNQITTLASDQITTESVLVTKISDENSIDNKTVESTTPIVRRRKIIRKKLKPVLTEEGKQRILQTKDETVITEEKQVEENKANENEDITTIKPTEQSIETTTINIDIQVDNTNETLDSSTISTTLKTRPTFKPVRKLIDVTSTTEPSTTSVKYSRRYNNGPFTTPVLPSERDTVVEKSRVENSPRRPIFNTRPINRRPITTPSTTTVDEEDDYNSDEYSEEEKNEEEGFVFVPGDQLYKRGPVKPVENTESDLESSDDESEEEPNQVTTTQRPVNRFAPGRRPPLIPNRAVPTQGRESNRPVNTPQGVRSTEEGGRKFNRPIAFQPNRSNRFSSPATTSQVETTTRSFLRKFSANRPQSDVSPTEIINTESVSAKHKQLFSNPRRFTTIKSSLQGSDSDSTTEYGGEVTTLAYDSEATTLNYDSETVTLNAESEADSDEWLSSTDSTEESVTEGDSWEKWIRNEINTNPETAIRKQPETEDTTIYSLADLTTPPTNIETNDTVRTSVQLDRLFAVSRVVEISSKEDKHKLNSKNETRLVEEGKIKQEKKPTVDKIGEVSRFTLIKIVEGDIPIYLTNLSHEYPVDNPPNNPIRIDEARNARALTDFTDSGKENLIASESVNAAYNHKNGVIELVQIPVELDYKTDTDEKGNKVYVVESTTLVDNTETPTETELPEEETYMTTNVPAITERMFVPGAIDIEALRNNVNVVTPKYIESSTLALEALFGINDTISSSIRQSKTVSGPQPFVVYASPIIPTDEQTETSKLNSSDSESTREASGRSIEGVIKIQVVQGSEKDGINAHEKDEVFRGIPAALDVSTVKDSPSSTTHDSTNQTTENTLSTTSILSVIPLTTSKVENSSDNINQTNNENVTHSIQTSTASIDGVSNTSTTLNVTSTTEASTSIETTVVPIEETTVTEVFESTTPISETVKPVLVKTLSSSLPSNSTASKFIKNRPKLAFPRRYQSNGTNSSSTTRLPFNPITKSNRNRTLSVSLDSKNVPYTTPKYNRTNSYTSGKSRFSATRTQNVPIDNRKKLEANKFKPSTTSTTTSPDTTSKIVNIPVEPTTAKVTIRRFKPRISPFAARRTTTSTEPSTQDSSVTEIPSDETTEKQKNPSARPTFFPRRTSNKFSNLNSERGRSSTTTTQASINEPTTTRYSSLRKRPSSLFSRKSSASSSLAADSTTTENTEASTARPNRLVVRKYYNKQRGGSGGATQNNTNGNSIEEVLKSTKAPEVTSRKPFRVGVRRRLPTRGTSSTTSSPTTVSSVKTTQYDQESFSTIQQSYEKDTIDHIKVKRVKLNKRPLFNNNDLIQENGNHGVDDGDIEEEINKGKKYSSVIKEDRTVVQQEVTVTPSGPREGLIGSIANDVTADVALAAHHLLSAPLPTIPTYAQEDQDYVTTPEENTFTRAYLLASISPPIISNDYLSTTEVPVVVTKFSLPTRGRKISTTNTPRVIYSSTFTQPAPVVRRRKPQTPAAFDKIVPVTNHYRTVVDYEYYDDDDIRLVGKNAQQEKVIIRGSGVIQCLDQGNFPHPNSCKKFISCAKMETGGVYGWEYTCPKGLSFDPVGGICNWSAGLGCNEH